jgi:hypothetical protein
MSMSLFDEMDAVADSVGERGDAEVLRGALKVEFRRLQRVRQPGIDGAEFDDLFQLWLERRSGQMRLRMAAADARLDALLKEQGELFARREPLPAGPERDALSARIMATSLDIMALVAPEQKPPMAVARWVGG